MPNNEDRANRIDVVFDTYAQFRTSDDDDASMLVDLLTDLRHWAAREGQDFENSNFLADIHFNTERET